jgi:signal transduction histidine kinase
VPGFSELFRHHCAQPSSTPENIDETGVRADVTAAWHTLCTTSSPEFDQNGTTSMTASPVNPSAPTSMGAWSLDRLFDATRKSTVIRLRWPLVILSSYLLYYNPTAWLSPVQVQAILILYLLSHSTLYFLGDDLFDSPYFYGPLLVFDTLVLATVLSAGGAMSPDFYVACLFTIVISSICNDTRGLLAVTLLAPLIYGYVVFYAADVVDPNIYLRLPFPFVISLFYGYFAQVERMRRTARERDEQARQEQKAAEEIRRQSERLEVLHHVNIAVTSTIDRAKLLESFLETALIHLPYAAGIVRLRSWTTRALETAATRGFRTKAVAADDILTLTDQIVRESRPLMAANVYTDRRVEQRQFFLNEGLASLIGVPLLANNETLGCLVFLRREEHEFGEEEVEFLSTLAGQAAIAIHHAELYEQSRRQAEELRGADKIKDEFLRAVSAQLKTPLHVINGYTEMFREGSLGELTPIQEKAIETIAKQSRGLHGAISSILQVTNFETEPLQPELREINVWELLSEIRSLYDEPLEKDVEVIWDYPFGFPALLGDRRKLKQIFENVISNAINFTERGTVTISVRYLVRNQTLELKVADTGAGIADEEICKIFDRFRKGPEGVAVANPIGVGLGLYVVKKYLDLLGGQVHVESRTGRGSTFTVQIPAPLKPSHAAHEQLPLPTEAELLSAAAR